MGVNDATYLIRTHLGSILKAGDLALGYDLQHTIVDDQELDLSLDSTPDVILVKKQFEKPVKPSGKKFRKKKRGNQSVVPEQSAEARPVLEDAEEDTGSAEHLSLEETEDQS